MYPYGRHVYWNLRKVQRVINSPLFFSHFYL